MVAILAVVTPKCRWIDCSRELDRWTELNINFEEKYEVIQVLYCNASNSLRDVRENSIAYLNSYFMNYVCGVVAT